MKIKKLRTAERLNDSFLYLSQKSVALRSLLIFIAALLFSNSLEGQVINGDETWSGSWSYSANDSCGNRRTEGGSISTTFTVNNGSISGTFTSQGWLCYKQGNCNDSSFSPGSGTVTGTISSNAVAFNFSGTFQGGNCAGSAADIDCSGTISGNTITCPFGTNGQLTLTGSPTIIPQSTAKALGCQCSVADPSSGNPIRIGTGNKYEEVDDYAPACLNPLEFIRYYNSQADTNTEAIWLGQNWRSTYDRYLRFSTSVVAEREDGQELVFISTNNSWVSDSDVDVKLVQSGSQWILTNSDDNIEIYDGAGLLTSILMRDGNVQTLTHNGAGQLITVTDSYSRTLNLTYVSNLLSTVTTPNGLVLTYGYTSSGEVPGILDRLASVSYNTSPATSQSYLYENSGFPFALTGIVDENSNRFATWTYDSLGRATSSQHAGGADLVRVGYNADGSRDVTNALGQVTVYKFAMLQGVPKLTEIDRLATVTTPAATMTQSYDSNGYLATSTDWNTNLTTMVDDVHDQTLTNNEAVGTMQMRTTTASYLTNFHLPQQIVAPRKTSTFSYDTNGNVLILTETDTSTGSVPYSTTGQTRSWTNTFTSWGRIYSSTGPRTDVKQTTSFTYGPKGNISSVTDPMGHETQFSLYNSSGLPLAMTDPNSVPIAFTYDIRNRLLTRAVQSSSGNATNTFGYDAAGQLISITLPNGTKLGYQYDAAHRLQSVTNSLGESIHYLLDVNGDITNQTIISSNGGIVKMQAGVFDQLGRMLREIGAYSETTSFGYDANGNRTRITDGLANTTGLAFDALNRHIATIDPLNNVTDYGYDPQNNPVSVTDPRSLVTSYVYDGFGHVIQESSPDKGVTVYILDKAGNRTNEVDARGIVTQRTFDKLNRVTAETFPASPSENIAFTYDATSGGNFGVGRLTGYTDETGSTTLTYNARGDVISTTRTIDGHAYVTTYAYDLADNVTNITYPSGHVISYGRDSQGRINSVTYRPSVGGTATTLASGVTYEPFGPLSGFVYGNGLVRSNLCDLDYRLSGITTKGNSASVQNLTLAYDAVNDIKTLTDNLAAGNSQAFAYDDDYRLTQAISGSYGSEAYSYDGDGNRLIHTTGGVTESYRYVTNYNRLQFTLKSGVTRAFSYANNGNMITDNRGSSTNYMFGYGSRNRYKTLTAGGATIASYSYNALGERLIKTVGITTTIYHFDESGHLIAESSSSGTLIREYVWLGDMPIAQIEASGTVYYDHADQLTRPQRMTDVNQNIVWDSEPQPFGEPGPGFYLASGTYTASRQFQINIGGQITYTYVVQASTNLALGNWVSLATNTGPFTLTDASTATSQARFYRVVYTPISSVIGTITNNLRFPGQYFDVESGLNYNMMRDYDTTLGQYIQNDPIGLAGGINLYGYVEGNPMRWGDRWGLDPFDFLMSKAADSGEQFSASYFLSKYGGMSPADSKQVADACTAAFNYALEAKKITPLGITWAVVSALAQSAALDKILEDPATKQALNSANSQLQQWGNNGNQWINNSPPFQWSTQIGNVLSGSGQK